jgi:PAS domain S-box-containing protein
LDYEALFAAMPTAYLVITPELVIVEANAAYLSLTGHRREDLVGRPVFEVFPPAPDALDEHGRNPLEESFKRARDTGRPDVMPLTKYDVQDPVTGRMLER